MARNGLPGGIGTRYNSAMRRANFQQHKGFGAIWVSCFFPIATAATLCAQQIETIDKNVVDHKTMADFKSAPDLPAEMVRIVPQMIGDHGSGWGLDPVKIAENESPWTANRLFVTYNYFNEIQQGRRRNDDLDIDVHREVIGFEKTFFNSKFSVGMRLPFSTRVETFLDETDSETNFGNMSLIGKVRALEQSQVRQHPFRWIIGHIADHNGRYAFHGCEVPALHRRRL